MWSNCIKRIARWEWAFENKEAQAGHWWLQKSFLMALLWLGNFLFSRLQCIFNERNSIPSLLWSHINFRDWQTWTSKIGFSWGTLLAKISVEIFVYCNKDSCRKVPTDLWLLVSMTHRVHCGQMRSRWYNFQKIVKIPKWMTLWQHNKIVKLAL